MTPPPLPLVWHSNPKAPLHIQIGWGDECNVTCHYPSLLTTPMKHNKCPPWPSMIGREYPPPGLMDIDEGPLTSMGPTTRINKHPWGPITINKGPPPGLIDHDWKMATRAHHHDWWTATSAHHDEQPWEVHWHLLQQTATGAHNDQQMANSTIMLSSLQAPPFIPHISRCNGKSPSKCRCQPKHSWTKHKPQPECEYPHHVHQASHGMSTRNACQQPDAPITFTISAGSWGLSIGERACSLDRVVWGSPI